MLLAIDIGNTNISFGIFKHDTLLKRFDFPTRNFELNKLKARLGSRPIGCAIISSVVPKATITLKSALRRLGIYAYIIGKDIKVPIKNLYRKPKQVGQDRLVNAYAGIRFYGAPLIVVDFGTAITFDCLSKKKEYMGGVILPGLRISLEALSQKTALLPKIKPGKPKEFIGRDTKNSLLSGIVYGFAALTDNLIERIKNKIGKNARVIGTGGNINLMAGYCKKINKIDRDLALKGLNLIYGKLLYSAAPACPVRLPAGRHCCGIIKSFH